jgi:hypothetical protein
VRPRKHTLRFWQTEVVVGEEQQTDSSPEEACLGTPVPFSVKQHARHDDVVTGAMISARTQ